MIDDDIRKLVDRDRGGDLRDLEADIWRLESTIRKGRRAVRKLAAWQSLLMVVAVVGSATMGFALTLQSPELRWSRVMLPGENLAPSALLFGRQ